MEKSKRDIASAYSLAGRTVHKMNKARLVEYGGGNPKLSLGGQWDVEKQKELQKAFPADKQLKGKTVQISMACVAR